MTRRERLQRCHFHQELDRPAVYSRTGFPGNDPSYDELKAYLRAHAELKETWSGAGPRTDWPSETRTEPYSADFERRIRILHTPKGDLRSSHLVSLRGQPGLDEEYLLKTREDAEKYLSLPTPEIGGEVASFAEADRAMGDAGIVVAQLGGIAGSVARLFGSETFAILSVMERDVLHALCERRMHVVLEQLDFLLEKGVGPYFGLSGEEIVAPPLHSPADFRDFNVRYDKPVIDRIHEAGGRVHIHCHGSVRKVFQDFIDMGTDVLHPFEAPPMGDITAAEAKQLADGRLCLEGNIQINRMYEATPDSLREETAELIRETFHDHKGLIVCPTASPYIRGKGRECFPRYKAMIDTVLQWKD